MLIKDRLARNRVHRPAGRQHAMGHAPAEPKPLLLVEIADVSHAMPDLLAVGDFRQRVPLGAGHILARHDRSADDQLADFAARQLFDICQSCQRPVDRANDLPFDLGKRRPTQVPAPCAPQGLAFRRALRWPRSKPRAAPRSRRKAYALRPADRCTTSSPRARAGGTGARPTARGAASAVVLMRYAVCPDAIPDGRRTE